MTDRLSQLPFYQFHPLLALIATVVRELQQLQGYLQQAMLASPISETAAQQLDELSEMFVALRQNDVVSLEQKVAAFIDAKQADNTAEKPTVTLGPLIYRAAADCSLECLRILLQHGVDINYTDEEDRSLLHVAISAPCMALLIEKGARIEAEDNRGRRPLHVAALRGNAPCVELLLKAGAQVQCCLFEHNNHVTCLILTPDCCSCVCAGRLSRL